MARKLTQLTERNARAMGPKSRVNRETKTVEGVKVIGPNSLNNREYPLACLTAALPLYENARVQLDHPAPGGDIRKDREIKSTWGKIINARIVEGSVFGDIRYIGEHRMTGQILETIEQMPEVLGLSHNAEGIVNVVEGVNVVESIEAVHSVDLVDRPATNKNLFESHTEPNTMKILTVKQILETCLPKSKRKNAAKVLREMDEAAVASGAEPPSEQPVEVEPDSSGEDRIKDAIRAAVMAAFDDDSLDAKATLAKIKDVLKAQDKLIGSPAAAPAAEPAAEEIIPESNRSAHSKEVAELREMVLADRAKAKKSEFTELLEAAEVDVTPVKLDALTNCKTNEGRRELIESWRAGDQSRSGSRPASTGSRYRQSSEGESYEDVRGESLVEN